MQLITAYAALFDGGRLTQHGMSLDVAPEHRTLLIEGMRGAVTYGTAERAALARIPLHIFGKTGTSSAGSGGPGTDRKSTRLNSSHANISYAVFCLKKKN